MAVKAQVVLPSVSGLPRDQVVNTFTLAKTAPGGGGGIQAWEPSDEDAGAIRDAIAQLFNAIAAPSTETLASFIGASIDRGAGLCQVRLYDTTPAVEGAPPLHVKTFTMGAGSGQADLPREVAMCGSFKDSTAIGTVAARRARGRVYFGPFNAKALGVPAGENARPDDLLRYAVYLGLKRFGLAIRGIPITTGGNINWVVHSTASGVSSYRTIDTVWTDNEFDTMRSRGLRATARDVATF